ncbi:hypothetical protein E4U53_001589 [Claviceps sorghi]|nr:hypothetical protein E4U53_001589 [Claviceps sorghi]
MYFTQIATAASVSLLAAQASAKTIRIDVGKNGLLTFSPESVKADKGDVLEFHFYGRHSVAMGDFANGCAPAAKGGFYSGIVRTSDDGSDAENNEVFQVTVSGTDPLPFYCTVESHCQAGMVGVVNPSSADSLDKYKKKTQLAEESTSPSATFGGHMVAAQSVAESKSPVESKSPDATSGGHKVAASSVAESKSPSTTLGGHMVASSGTSAAPQPSKTGAASQIKMSLLGGVGAAALGFAALLI